MSNDAQTPIEGWAIVELFGHNKIAGYVTTAIIGTSGMLRVDVPEVEEAPAYTRFYGPGAIYSLTLVTEEIARAALKAIRPDAVTVYIPRQLPEPRRVSRRDEDDEDDDAEPCPYCGEEGCEASCTAALVQDEARRRRREEAP